MTGANVLGRICEKMIFGSGVPIARAARTNWRSRMETACPRIIRVYQGHHEIAIARMAFSRLGPKNEEMAIANNKGGKDRKIFVKRMMISSAPAQTSSDGAKRSPRLIMPDLLPAEQYATIYAFHKEFWRTDHSFIRSKQILSGRGNSLSSICVTDRMPWIRGDDRSEYGDQD